MLEVVDHLLKLQMLITEGPQPLAIGIKPGIREAIDHPLKLPMRIIEGPQFLAIDINLGITGGCRSPLEAADADHRRPADLHY